MKLIDLTHTLHSDISTWDGSCGFKQKLEIDYEEDKDEVSFRVQSYSIAAGIGTHMDAPSHCIRGAHNINEISLEQLYAPCAVIDISSKACPDYLVTADDICLDESINGEIEKGSFVIVYTGWDRYWGDAKKYRNNLVFPSISSEAAQFLLDKEISGLGIDTLSPDRADSLFPVHQLMLARDKYIIENVANAKSLPSRGAFSLALPLKIEHGTESPIRLIAFIEKKTIK